MRRAASDLDGMANALAGLFCPYDVAKGPPENRETLGLHAAELVRLAGRTEGKAPP